METATSFRLCTVLGVPSDGHILMDLDRPTGPVTISFDPPVSAFGAYWGSGRGCFGNPPSILTFKDVAGHVIGTDSFVYLGDGRLTWHRYRFGTPVKTIIRTAGDNHEGVAIDGLQATASAWLPPGQQWLTLTTTCTRISCSAILARARQRSGILTTTCLLVAL
jgi:hypothetical protein